MIPEHTNEVVAKQAAASEAVAVPVWGAQQLLHVTASLRAAGLDAKTNLSSVISRAQKHFANHGTLDGWNCEPSKDSAQRIVRHHMGKAKAHRREMAKELRAIGYQGRYATADEVLNLMAEAHDRALEEGRPSARAILRNQVGHEDAPRLATTKSRHVKAAMQKLAGHPTAQLMEAQGMRTARDVSEICKGTLAGGVQALYQRADVARRLSEQDNKLAELAAMQDEQARELAELRRQLTLAHAQTEARLSAVEAATDWKAAAVRLKAEGLSAAEIARRLGQKPATVRQHLHRHG